MKIIQCGEQTQTWAEWVPLGSSRWELMAPQRNRWILLQSDFVGSFDATWSESPRIMDSDLDYRKETHPHCRYQICWGPRDRYHHQVNTYFTSKKFHFFVSFTIFTISLLPLWPESFLSFYTQNIMVIWPKDCAFLCNRTQVLESRKWSTPPKIMGNRKYQILQWQTR